MHPQRWSRAAILDRNLELEANEERLRFALSAGGLGSWTLILKTGEFRACDNLKSIYGRPVGEPFTYDQLRASIHPDDRDLRTSALRHAIEHGDDIVVDFRIRIPDGGERWIHVCGRVEYEPDGTPLLVGGISQDITARRRDEDHRTLLAHELSHRVKNTLTALQAVVAQTMRRAASIEDAASTLASRIQAMSAANDLLIAERFESASIRDLLDRALAPFGVEDDRRFVLEGADVSLPPRLVTGFALALHELATNATKYGALSDPEGVVHVAWTVLPRRDGRHLRLRWTERGGPSVAPPSRTSFGSALIQRVLASEIGGTAELTFPAAGVVFTAVAPLPETMGVTLHAVQPGSRPEAR
jgi:two-component sensor histidine kinase